MQRLAGLVFLHHLAFLRPEADRTDFVLPLVNKSQFDCPSSINLIFESALELWKRVEIIIFAFERIICAEVVTYRFDVVLGSLSMLQLRGFNEWLCDQWGDLKPHCRENTTIVLLFFSESNFNFKIVE
jgi:hypothetical protein